jgi:hypothetical protein
MLSSSSTMFRKQPSHIASSTAIRSSDRRKLLNEIFRRYGISTDGADDDGVAGVAGVEWTGLVPMGIRCGKVTTSSGIKCVSGV